MSLLGKACPRPPGIDQLSPIVVPEQQSTDPMAPIRGQRKPADNKLLLMNALQLQPIAAAPARIRARRTFGDDSLRMQLTRPLEYLAAATLNVFAEAQKVSRTIDDGRKDILTFTQRQFPHRMPIQMQQIEHKISKRLLYALLKR